MLYTPSDSEDQPGREGFIPAIVRYRFVPPTDRYWATRSCGATGRALRGWRTQAVWRFGVAPAPAACGSGRTSGVECTTWFAEDKLLEKQVPVPLKTDPKSTTQRTICRQREASSHTGATNDLDF